MRSTASSGSLVQMKREAACSSSSSSARRASSRGSSTPCLDSAGSASGAQKRQSRDGGGAVRRVRELDLDHPLDAGRIGARLLGARRGVREQALGVELARLARRRDEAALGAREARALRPAGGDPDRDRLLGQVVDRRRRRCGTSRPSKCTCSPVQSWRISATASRRRSRRSPAPGHSTPVGATSFMRLAGAEAEEDAAGREAAERREGLRDDRRVVAVGRRQHARADEHARGLRRPARRATAATRASARRRAGTAGSDPRSRRCRGRGARRRRRTRAARRARTARPTPCSRGAVGEMRREAS